MVDAKIQYVHWSLHALKVRADVLQRTALEAALRVDVRILALIYSISLLTAA